MISYLVQVAVDGVMKYEYPFDNYVEELRCFIMGRKCRK